MSIVIIAFITEAAICYCIGMPAATVDMCDSVSIVLLASNTMLLIYYIRNKYKDYGNIVVYCLILSALLKSFLILWDYYGTSIFVLPNSHSDTESFHKGAVLFSRQSELIVENYSYIVGYIYRLFGVQRITAQYFNVLLSFWGIDLFADILDMIELNEINRKKALIFAALLPNYLIFSSILARECVISVLLCAALYCFMIWWTEGTLLSILLTYAFVLSACYFHSGAIAVAIGLSCAFVLTRKGIDGNHYIRVGITNIFVTFALVLAFSFVFQQFSDTLFKRFGGGGIDDIQNYIDDHDFYDLSSASNNSAYTAGSAEYRGLAGLIINSPIRILYFLWVPMPWMMRGLSDLVAFCGSSLFYGGVAFRSLFTFAEYQKKNKALFLVLIITAFCGAFVFAWGTDSAGSALRHREKFYFIFLLLYALMIDNKKEEKEPLNSRYLR